MKYITGLEMLSPGDKLKRRDRAASCIVQRFVNRGVVGFCRETRSTISIPELDLQEKWSLAR